MRSPRSSTNRLAPPSAVSGVVVLQNDPGTLAREILSERGYQTELPMGQPQAPASFGFLEAIMPLLFWMSVVIAVVLFFVWLVSWFTGSRGIGEDSYYDLEGDDSRAHAAPSLEEAERLAREGCYGDATHALLLAAIAHLGSGLEQPPRPSDTSREILRALPLRKMDRRDLRYLVGLVEVYLFGGRDLVESEYLDSRKRFDQLVAGGAA